MNLLSETTTLAFLGPIGWPELLIIAFLGLLIFGKRLPDIGKGLGKGIVSFKKGLQGVQDDIQDSVNKEDDDEVDEPKRLEAKGKDSTDADVKQKDQAHA